MNSLVLVLGAACIFAIAYRFYGAFLAARVAVLNDARATPAVRLNDGKDYFPTNRWVLFGHHFAAISGAGPLIGPVLAAQFGYAPGAIWILVGCVGAGAVHDFVILFASVQHDGFSLSKIAEREIGSRVAGIATMFAIFFIIMTALAGLAIAVVNALSESSWGTFSIAATIPVAFFVGLYMYVLRPGKIGQGSAIGVALVFAAVILGHPFARSSLSHYLVFSQTQLKLILPAYGFLASSLPVWMLLCPRDYLSSYMKIGTIGLLALGIFFVHPDLQMPAVTPFIHGGGPIIPGKVWPFVCVTIACGAISGFHSLIGSGTTPKMIKKEKDILPIGMGAMLIEGFVAIMALVAATCLFPGDYFAINSQPADFARLGMHVQDLPALTQLVGEENLVGRTGGAVSLAVGMARIFTGIPGMKSLMSYWYHFAIMFEALFILTTIDTGTRVARFILQELMMMLVGRKPAPAVEAAEESAAARHVHSPIETAVPARPQVGAGGWKRWVWIVGASALTSFSWGYLLFTGNIKTIWPMFGVANQLLATLALAIGTTFILRRRRKAYALVTFVPFVFMFVTTLTAGYYNVTSSLNAAKPLYLNAVLAGLMMFLVVVIAATAARGWVGHIARSVPIGPPRETVAREGWDISAG